MTVQQSINIRLIIATVETWSVLPSFSLFLYRLLTFHWWYINYVYSWKCFIDSDTFASIFDVIECGKRKMIPSIDDKTKIALIWNVWAKAVIWLLGGSINYKPIQINRNVEHAKMSMCFFVSIYFCSFLFSRIYLDYWCSNQNDMAIHNSGYSSMMDFLFTSLYFMKWSGVVIAVSVIFSTFFLFATRVTSN